MRITAITRFKHGELYAILCRLEWTQNELARRTGIHARTIGEIINLVRRPNSDQADAIQKVIGEAGEYLDVLAEWPEAFKGIKRGFRHIQTAEIPTDRLLDHPEVMQIAAPEVKDTSELESIMEQLVSTLPKSSQHVLRERFWNNKTQGEIAQQMGVTDAAIGPRERTALRLLRSPSRLKVLEEVR